MTIKVIGDEFFLRMPDGEPIGPIPLWRCEEVMDGNDNANRGG